MTTLSLPLVEAPPRTWLQMVWPEDRLLAPPTASPPAGYDIRTYRPGDEADFFALALTIGFNSVGDADRGESLSTLAREGCFFAEDRASGELVAVAMATDHPTPEHPAGGEISWLAVDPEHRQRGLGRALLATATAYLLERGYRDIFLRTEEARPFALGLYLKMGFVPLLSAAAPAERWRAVCRLLDWPFTPEQWPTLTLSS